MSNEYVNLDELKYTLEITNANLDNDISLALESASRAVDKITGRRFYTTTADEIRYFTACPDNGQYYYVDGQLVGGRGSYIDVGDLVSVTAIAVDTNADGTYDQNWIQDTDYRLTPYNASLDGLPYTQVSLIPAAGRVFPVTDKAVRVTGKFGWASPPPEVKEATELLAIRRLRLRREGGALGVVALGPDGIAGRIPRPSEIYDLLGPFKRQRLA